MPYKDPEKRKEAVRRHRQKQRELKEIRQRQTELARLLTDDAGYETMPFNDFIEMCQDLTVEEDQVILEGKPLHMPQVFVGSDEIIILRDYNSPRCLWLKSTTCEPKRFKTQVSGSD